VTRRRWAALVAAVFATALVALAAAILFLRAPLEHAIRSRIEREAVSRGLVARVQEVHVGLGAPVRLLGVRVDKPGLWSIATDVVDVSLRARGSGLLGRARLAAGPMTVTGPHGWAASVAPTRWHLSTAPGDSVRAELTDPPGGLTVTWQPSREGGRVSVTAGNIRAGGLITVTRNGKKIVDLGQLGGTLGVSAARGSPTALELDMTGHAMRLPALASEAGTAEEPAPDFGDPTDVTLRLSGSWNPVEKALKVPRWRLTLGGAALSGSLALDGVGVDPRLELALDVERVDFARLLRTSGAGEPAAVTLLPSSAPAADLGSLTLSARASGRLADPASFDLQQQLDYTPPRQGVPAIEKLRGAFVHEVALPGGARKSILVSPSSPDFIAIGDVPPLFVRTLLLGEDAGFWGHRGVDLGEIPAAIFTNWERGGVARGASTITQQLAKNLFLSSERRLGRKLQEVALAMLLEATLTKQRILEIYMNVIEWGPGLYGLRPAARHYFNVEPGALTPKQMAFLVALIPGPIKYQRSFASGTLSPGFRPLVDALLAKLRSVDAIGEEEYQAALAEELRIGPL
jgi:penicillin-binding protein 1A